jgi:hypothetical protein
MGRACFPVVFGAPARFGPARAMSVGPYAHVHQALGGRRSPALIRRP